MIKMEISTPQKALHNSVSQFYQLRHQNEDSMFSVRQFMVIAVYKITLRQPGNVINQPIKHSTESINSSTGDLAVKKGAENASTGKRIYGKGKYETAHFARMENARTENVSTNLQGWKTQVRKMQVQCKPSVR